MSSRYKVMCGCECCISTKNMHSSLLLWRDRYLEKPKDLRQNYQNRRSGKNQITYMKLIKIQSCHMGVIFKPKHMTCQRQQCVLNHILIMRYHTGNVYWDVVPNVLALIFLTRKQMMRIPTSVLQLVFIFITWLHVVQNMAGLL